LVAAKDFCWPLVDKVRASEETCHQIDRKGDNQCVEYEGDQAVPGTQSPEPPVIEGHIVQNGGPFQQCNRNRSSGEVLTLSRPWIFSAILSKTRPAGDL
jgi:hypothetical protein